MTADQPLVSIVTPVYNGAEFLAECIESVISQTYANWEYLIVDNCSTDETAAIARRYAALDTRIKLHSFSEFVTLVQNFNRAVRLISPHAKYCKVLSADDWLFPACVERQVVHCERHPEVGIVGAYQLSGGESTWTVKYAGLPHPSDEIAGRTICRWHLLGGVYVFGTPTSTLYRAALVRNTATFFPGPPQTMHSDVSACYEQLQRSKFGFIHEVLSFERIHDAAASTALRENASYLPGEIEDLRTYGRNYLREDEYARREHELLSTYYRFLGARLLRRAGNTFWSYHTAFLNGIGERNCRIRIARSMVREIFGLLLCPARLHRYAKRLFGRSAASRTEPITLANVDGSNTASVHERRETNA